MHFTDLFFPVFVVAMVACTIVAVVVCGPPTPESPAVSDYARTINHDGHQFVIYRSVGGIIHHPSCTCLLKPDEKE
jgi:hypothetical protein